MSDENRIDLPNLKQFAKEQKSEIDKRFSETNEDVTKAFTAHNEDEQAHLKIQGAIKESVVEEINGQPRGNIVVVQNVEGFTALREGYATVEDFDFAVQVGDWAEFHANPADIDEHGHWRIIAKITEISQYGEITWDAIGLFANGNEFRIGQNQISFEGGHIPVFSDDPAEGPYTLINSGYKLADFMPREQVTPSVANLGSFTSLLSFVMSNRAGEYFIYYGGNALPWSDFPFQPANSTYNLKMERRNVGVSPAGNQNKVTVSDVNGNTFTRNVNANGTGWVQPNWVQFATKEYVDVGSLFLNGDDLNAVKFRQGGTWRSNSTALSQSLLNTPVPTNGHCVMKALPTVTGTTIVQIFYMVVGTGTTPPRTFMRTINSDQYISPWTELATKDDLAEQFKLYTVTIPAGNLSEDLCELSTNGSYRIEFDASGSSAVSSATYHINTGWKSDSTTPISYAQLGVSRQEGETATVRQFKLSLEFAHTHPSGAGGVVGREFKVRYNWIGAPEALNYLTFRIYALSERSRVTLNQNIAAPVSPWQPETDFVDLEHNPQNWRVGTEYRFSPTLYGRRFTGTITAGANAVDFTILANIANIANIQSCGGTLYRTSALKYGLGQVTLAANDVVDFQSAVYLTSGGTQLTLTSKTTGARAAQSYDVWVKYTKT